MLKETHLPFRESEENPIQRNFSTPQELAEYLDPQGWAKYWPKDQPQIITVPCPSYDARKQFSGFYFTTERVLVEGELVHLTVKRTHDLPEDRK